MKDKMYLVHKLALVLIVLATFGCGTSSQATPSTSTESAAPEAEPTDAPASAPEVLPDISSARISLEDLPPGFEALPIDEAGIKEASSSDEGFQPQVVFAFINKDQFQVIIGMNFLLDNGFARLGFGAALEDPDSLKQFVSAMDGENMREERILTNLAGIAEKQTAMTIVADVEGVPMRVDAAMLQRDIVGGLILSMRIEGETASISLKDLAALFDQHIQENLSPIE